MITRKTKATLLASSVIFGSLIAMPAMAQDDPTMEPAAAEENAILVTGTRIQRRDVDTAAPVAVVDSEEFSLSGAVNVESVINTLPQVIPGFTSASNNPGTGASTLNLRGLGSTRTMVLVNGRRWMFYDTNQVVDLNTIPQFLLDGVDVVTGGASAVYGSDALAGVVNFRLRHVDGAEVGGQYSITERGDGQRYQLHGAIGTEFADGRGRATVFGEYYNRESIFQGDRGFSRVAVGAETFDDFLQAFGSSTMPATRFNAPTEVGIVADADCDIPGQCAPLADGLVLDDAIFDVGSGGARARAGDTYNYAPANYLQIPQERYLLGGYAEYEIFTGHEVYTEVSYVNNRVAQELAATPVTGTFLVDLDTVQPFVSDAVFTQLQQLDANETAANAARLANGLSALPGAAAGVVSTSIQRRTIETGSRNTLDERNAFRVLGGLRGDITDYINYDAYYSYARTRNANVQAGNISRSAFAAGLDGTGTPINIFDEGGLTPEMVDAISIQAQNGDVSTLEVLTGYLSGTFGDFAIGNAAPIGFALGGEYRRMASQFIPDTALSSGDVIGFNAGDATEGAYSVKEIFGELNIPVIETDGGMTLDLSAAGRYSDYSLEAVGGVWAYAGGVEFAPFDGLKFRGQYQRAVRAPNVGELFQGQAIGFPGATDPCGNQEFLNQNPGADAVCVATGVPQSNLGNASAVQLNAQIPALFGGNPNLQEEVSDSMTFGVVIQPAMVPGLTITADYFDIVIENAISVAGGSLQGLFDLCYRDVQDVNSAACQPFVGIRNSDGAITTDAPPLVSNANLAELGVSGIDLQISYGMDLPFSVFSNGGVSDFNISFLGTWTESSYFIPVAELNQVTECASQFGGQCGQPTPGFKWTSRFSWVDGPFTMSTRWRHLSAVDDQDDTVDYSDWNGIERIGAYDLIDLTLSYDWNEAVTISAGVNNLFDTLPGTPTFDADGLYVTNRPNSLLLGDNQEQANTYPSTYDTLGRDFFVSAVVRF
ncbi:MAG: TonB-dependent receptor [Erythrobacter sp.]|nr:MAG: TonB-dependent receptor [Erythrobacter sp.]